MDGLSSARLIAARATPVDHHRSSSIGGKGPALLEAQRQFPAVTVVVGVVEDVSRVQHRLSEADLAGRDAARVTHVTFFDVPLTEEQLAGPIERIATERETPQMRVGPVERGLQNPVEFVEPEVRADLDPPPDRRRRTGQVGTDLEGAWGRRRLPAELGS
jgi:hypothetical protein